MLLVLAFLTAKVLVFFRLYLELLPLRLHLDQAHINFLMSFFNQGPFDDFSPGSSNTLDESDMSKIVEALSPFFQASSFAP